MGWRRRRQPGRRLAGRGDRRRVVRGAGRARRRGRADALPQRARGRATVPHRACRVGGGTDDHPRLGARRGDRLAARRRALQAARRHRGADRGRDVARRRHAPPHRRLGRRHPAPLGPRRAACARGSAAQPRARRRARPGGVRRPLLAAEARASGRRRQRLPGRPVRAGHDRAAAPDRPRRRAVGGDGGRRVRSAGRGQRRLPASRPVGAAAVPAGQRHLGRDRRARGPVTRGDARALRHRGDDRRPDLGPARHALRAPARARHEGEQGGRAQGRSLLRARHDRDPDPRSDPRQAGRRRRGSEPEPADRHARGHLRRPARLREPAQRLARQGHLRQRGVGRPGPHAAPAHRRHHRLGQVRLHQHAADVDPPARHARRRPADPDRPQAHRAQLLRVDPAPADAGRLQPEGGERRPHQRGGGDGAPLRAALTGAGAEPAGGEPRLPLARRGDAAVPARRHRRARRPDDDLAAGRRGRGDPAGAEVACGGHPSRARHAAAVRRRHHRA